MIMYESRRVRICLYYHALVAWSSGFTLRPLFLQRAPTGGLWKGLAYRRRPLTIPLLRAQTPEAPPPPPSSKLRPPPPLQQHGVVHFRNATIDDLDLLRHWDNQPHVVAHAGDEAYNDWNWDAELRRNPSWRHLWIAQVALHNGDKNNHTDFQPIGIVQIIDPAREDSHYWGNLTGEETNLRAVDIWIGETSYLGQGYGTNMMEQVLAYCFRSTNNYGNLPDKNVEARTPVQAVLVDPLVSNTRGHKFYRSLGFKPLEKRYFGPDHCYVHRIDRVDWEKKMMKK